MMGFPSDFVSFSTKLKAKRHEEIVSHFLQGRYLVCSAHMSKYYFLGTFLTFNSTNNTDKNTFFYLCIQGAGVRNSIVFSSFFQVKSANLKNALVIQLNSSQDTFFLSSFLRGKNVNLVSFFYQFFLFKCFNEFNIIYR